MPHPPFRPRRRATLRATLSGLAALAAVAVATTAAGPAQAGTTPPRLTITTPPAHAGKTTTVTATLTGLPSGQSAKITMAGLACKSATVTKGAAKTTCTFRPTAVGAYTLKATAVRYSRGRTAGATTTSQRVTALGVAVTAPTTLRYRTRSTIKFVVGAGWAPGTTMRLTPGITGATGCPTTITLRLTSQRTATATCTITPQAAATVRIAAQVRAGAKGLMSAPPLTRTVTEGAPMTAAAAAARWRTQSQALWDLARKKPAAASHDAASTGLELRLLARRDGWDAPTTTTALEHLLSLRNPDGGWGVQVAWDAFADGTTNPVDTSYTVTTAEHVGPALLEAWQNDAVADDELRTAVDSVLAAPTMPVPGGRCIAYSSSRNDAGPCVPNVSLGAGAWLKNVRTATGWRIPELDQRIADVTGTLRYLYNPTTGYWAYSDLPVHRGRPQDARHQGYTLQSVHVLDPQLGRTASSLVTGLPWWRQPTRGPVTDFGNGLSQIAYAHCKTTAVAPSVLDAHATIINTPAASLTRFLALQGAMYGFRTLGVCFTGQRW